MDQEWPDLTLANQAKVSKKNSKAAIENKTKIVKVNNEKKETNSEKTQCKPVNMKNAIREFNEKFAYQYDFDSSREYKLKSHCSVSKECSSTGASVEESFKSMMFSESIICVRMNLLYFYFHEANLRKDSYMIKNMDNNGWIPLNIVMDFPRLKRTKPTFTDIFDICQKLLLPPFTIQYGSVENSYLEIDKTNSMIRRNDMEGFESTFRGFEISKEIDLKMRLELPFPNYSFSYFETELEPLIERFIPEIIPQINVEEIGENITFEFGASEEPTVQTKKIYRKRCTTTDSQSDLDESNVYLITLNGKTAEWHEISDSDSFIEQTYPDSEKRDLLRKSLQETFNSRSRYQSFSSCSTYDSNDESDSHLPDSQLSIEEKMSLINTNNNPSVLIHKMKPLNQEIQEYDFLNEGAISSYHNPIDMFNSNFPSIPNNKSDELDKLLENIIYEYKKSYVPQEVLKTSRKPKIRPVVRKTRNHLNFYDSENDDVRSIDDPMMGYYLNKNRRKRNSSSSSYSQYPDSGKLLSKGLEIPHQNHPGEKLLSDEFKLNLYLEFRENALKDRKLTGCGRSADMNALLRFWSFFLRENSQKKMYREFQDLAWEDAEHGYRYGVECVFRMFSYKLENKDRFNMDEYNDFQKNVLRDLELNSLYGLEKFWALRQYGNLTLEAIPEIEEKLKEYKTKEDFRKNFIPPQGFYGYKLLL